VIFSLSILHNTHLRPFLRIKLYEDFTVPTIKEIISRFCLLCNQTARAETLCHLKAIARAHKVAFNPLKCHVADQLAFCMLCYQVIYWPPVCVSSILLIQKIPAAIISENSVSFTHHVSQYFSIYQFLAYHTHIA